VQSIPRVSKQPGGQKKAMVKTHLVRKLIEEHLVVKLIKQINIYDASSGSLSSEECAERVDAALRG
jgi:hypothetical protein